MKVVIADDSKVMRSIIEKAVKPMGFDTIHAANGQEVLDLLVDQWQDIGFILLDWNMPVMNGLQVLESMKENKQYKKIPVFIVSTEAETEKKELASKAGAKGYLSKPFTPSDLINLINKTI